MSEFIIPSIILGAAVFAIAMFYVFAEGEHISEHGHDSSQADARMEILSKSDSTLGCR